MRALRIVLSVVCFAAALGPAESNAGAWVQRFAIDASTIQPSGPGVALPVRSAVRGLAVARQARRLTGDGIRPRLLSVDVSTDPVTIDELTLPQGDLSIGSVHGVCQLPGGTIVAGEFTVSAPNRALELLQEGFELQALASVYSTVPAGHAQSHCQAASDDEIY